MSLYQCCCPPSSAGNANASAASAAMAMKDFTNPDFILGLLSILLGDMAQSAVRRLPRPHKVGSLGKNVQSRNATRIISGSFPRHREHLLSGQTLTLASRIAGKSLPRPL